jgi:hypothetical protein
MKERPILFSTPMVRAILDGRKTQTRRMLGMSDRGQFLAMREGRAVFGDSIPDDPCPIYMRCPYGEPGDRLWVREKILRLGEPEGHERWCQSIYAADAARTVADCWPWQRSFLPPMHMPRGLCRIMLAVTSVRVERLQEITEDDARAEGLALAGLIMPGHAVGCFSRLWDEINGKRAPWASNPWVWVVSFELAGELVG